ncbi:MAG: ParB N-terminal domain-containing protein [Clostridia bacterium]|nr:ParB N-terminal domain-containing protein [Clostridia bacterium]
MNIVNKKIEEIKPYENNPRKNEEAVRYVSNSIKEFGFKVPVIIDKTNVIVAGHTRYKAAKKLKLTQIPCIVVEDLTQEQIKAFRLADNKVSEKSEWDFKILDEELNHILDIDMGDFGFEFNIQDDKQIIEDKISEVPEKPKSKLGYIYKLGKHRLMCGDSTNVKNIERLMEKEKADMIFTDPPYGMNLDTDFTTMVGINKGKKYKPVKGDKEDFTSELIESIFNNFNYCKEIFLWGADYYAELIPNRNKGSWIVWDKQDNGEGCNDNYDKMFGSNFELCWSKNKHKRALARVLWKGFLGMQNEDIRSRIHPTQKPVALAKWFLEKFSKESALIVDLYGGSGSTLIACEQMKRKCYMIEYDAGYIDAIINRWEKFTGEKATLLKD